MTGSVDTRRGELSAVVRVRSAATATANSALSSATSVPPDLRVQPEGRRHVSVEVPEGRTTRAQKGSFEVTRVLPLDANSEEIFTGVGDPVVKWLRDGFNALILSYGQARSGKTTLLMGSGSSSHTRTEGCPPERNPSTDNEWASREAGSNEGSGQKEREEHAGEGLLAAILRGLFENAPAVSSSAAAAPDDETDHFRGENLFAYTVNSANDVLNPLAGSWSPCRQAHGQNGFGISPDGASTPCGSAETNPNTDVAAAPQDNPHGARIVALSAWEVSGKNVTDLFVSPPHDSGPGGAPSPATGDLGALGGKGGGNSNSNGNIRSTLGNSEESGKSRRGSRSRSRNRGKKGKQTGEGARGDEAVGNGTNGSGRSQNSRGRSGSDDSSAAGEGWPTGYPEDFLTARAPDLATALELVNTARRRCSTGLRERAEVPSAGSKGKGNGGRKTGAAAAAATAAAANVAAKGHVFFRVVVYDAVEETVSTLHVVDLAGGWEPPAEKPAGRRGSKGSGAGSARPSATSREWNSFDAMLTGLVAPAPPTRGSLGDTAAVGTSAAMSCTCTICGSDTSADPHPEGTGRSSGRGGLGVQGRKRGLSGEDACTAGSDAVLLDLGSNDDAHGEDRKTSLGSTTADLPAQTPCANAVPGSEPQAPIPPPPLPRPHPVFGSPKGKSFGGGGGGKLVEALQPLISGNTRTWLVVSVGGEGQGGPGGAWRALDVARRATGISTTCIRLRGVSLADLRLRSAEEVLIGGNRSSEPNSTNGSSLVPSDAGPGVGVRRDIRTRPPAANPPVKHATASCDARPSLGDAKQREESLVSPAPLGQSRKSLGSPGTEHTTESQSSPAISLPGLADGGDLLSLASMTFGEEIRGGGRVERGGGGEGSGATSCLDDFLAGFVRGSDNGGGDDDRPRRISSDGLLGSHVALEETREEVAAAWRTIGDTTTDTEWEEKGGGGSDRVVPTEVRGSESSPASSEGNFPRSSGSEGQPRRQQQHRAPLRQGSSLRPGGRAASVGSTPSVPTASAVGRPEAKASAIPNGMGSVLGSKCFEDRDPATHLSPDEGIEDRNDRSTALDGATTIGGAARRSEGGGNVPPGALRAKENIDRMMSSLLEDVLPSRRNATPSGTILGSPGPGASSGTVNSCVSLPVTAGQPRPAAADSHGTSAPRSSPNHSRSPATSSSRPAMRNPAHPTSGRGRTDDSKDSSGVFLTPIEVIMHAPAGGCGSTDREAGGCRQCAVSAKTPTDGAATGTLQKPPEIASSSVGGGSKVPMLGERRVRNARGLDEQTSTSTHQANGTILSTSNSSSNRSGQNNTNGSSSDSNSARPRRVLSDRGAHQPGVSNGGGAEREAEHSLKREAGVAAPADNNAYESEEQILSTTGAEVALLRRNHATLLRVIREQRERETQIERRFEDKERDWLERVTTLEADLEGLRADKVETRGRLRRAEVSSPSSEVFERYEAHAGLLEAENTSLRDQNMSLEMRLLDVLQQSTTSSRPGPTKGTAPTSTAESDIAVKGKQTGRHRQSASPALSRARMPQQEEKRGEDEREGRYDVPLHQRTCEAGVYFPEADVPKPCPGYSRGDGEVTSGYRVDGRVAPSGCGGRAARSQPGGGAPMCAAVLKDLRRRLKEVELEAKEMRAERAAVEKRDRLCQAQLRTLTEQRSKMRELFLREKEHEAKLTSSRLESARAEVIAENKAAEIETLRRHQASLAADREALVLELAEERRKSRQFEEDRRAYGHIRRFIERHAGGRPAEWDSSDSPPVHDEEEGSRVHGTERERRHRQGVRRNNRKYFDKGDTVGGVGVGERKDELDEPIFGLAEARGSEAEGVGRFVEATPPRGRRQERPNSVPLRATRVVDDMSPIQRCRDDSSGHLYSDAHRNKLNARLGIGLGMRVGGGILGYEREDADRGARLQRESSATTNKRSDECDGISRYSHHALNFRADREGPQTDASRTHVDGHNVSLQARKGFTANDSRRHRRDIAADDEWTDDAYGNNASGNEGNESIPYSGDSFTTTSGGAARTVSATGNATRPQRGGRRGVDCEFEAERLLERRFGGVSASNRLSTAGAGSTEASVLVGANGERRIGSGFGLEDVPGGITAGRRRRELTGVAAVSSGLGTYAADRYVGRAWLA